MSEQQKQKLLASGDLISMTEAAQYAPYSAEYLSLLARKQKILAIKINRDWLTTRQAVLLYAKAQAKKHKQLLDKFELMERRTI